MEQNQYQVRLVKLLDDAVRLFDEAEQNSRLEQVLLMMAEERMEMANMLSLGIIALSLSQLVGIGNSMADDLNNVAGTIVQNDLMDEAE